MRNFGGGAGASRLELPRLDGQHLDIESQSFARERVIKVKNNCFLFDLTDMDNKVIPLWSADAERGPNLEGFSRNFGLRDFLEGLGINRPVRFLRLEANAFFLPSFFV
jgi:hypothetical protein